jgi:hypothetical protein
MFIAKLLEAIKHINLDLTPVTDLGRRFRLQIHHRHFIMPGCATHCHCSNRRPIQTQSELPYTQPVAVLSPGTLDVVVVWREGYHKGDVARRHL